MIFESIHFHFATTFSIKNSTKNNTCTATSVSCKLTRFQKLKYKPLIKVSMMRNTLLSF